MNYTIDELVRLFEANSTVITMSPKAAQAPGTIAPGATAPQYSEIALADAFTARHAAHWRYVATWGKWLHWDGSVWQDDTRMEVWNAARAIVGEASRDLAADQKATAARQMASASTVSAVLRLSRAHAAHAASVDQWDADPWVLNTPAGWIDLHTGTLSPHDPAMYCSRMTAAAPADHVPENSRWRRFLLRVCGGDERLIAFLQRAAGYSLTGSTREEAFFFLHGLGQNGKSKFMEALAGVMGTYHEAAAMETFVASPMPQHPADLAKLRVARLVTASETEEGRRWAESKIKQVTGGDPVSARYMRQDWFTFRPQFKLWIAGNHKPGLRNVDPAMRRRMNLIPFTVAIPEHERDRNLSLHLKEEWPVILRWMIDGCLAWGQEGLATPVTVRTATDDYLASEDAIAQWLDDTCDLSPAFQTRSSAAFESWKLWAERAGEFVGTQKRFSQRLEERGFEKKLDRTGRLFVGFRVK